MITMVVMTTMTPTMLDADMLMIVMIISMIG